MMRVLKVHRYDVMERIISCKQEECTEMKYDELNHLE